MDEYLGDGVYAHFDGYQIELRANDPHSENVVYIEPYVLDELNLFYARCVAQVVTRNASDGDNAGDEKL